MQVATGVENRIVLRRPRLHFLAAGATRFDHDSALLVPSPHTGERHPIAALVHAMLALVRDEQRVLRVVGHTSEPGSDSHNQSLSEARAQCVRCWREADESGWVDLATQDGSLCDVLAYLRYLRARRGWACTVGGDYASWGTEATAASESAVSAFQSEYNERFEGSLGVDGDCGKKTLAAMFAVQLHELERWLAKFGMKREELPLERVEYAGLGSHMAGKRGKKEAVDRVVDLILGEGEQVERLEDTRGLYEAPAFKRVYDELPDEPFDWEGGPLTIVTDLCEREAQVLGHKEIYRLSAEDGSWDEELRLPEDAHLDNGTFALRFGRLDCSKQFRLVVVDEHDDEHLVFSNRSFAELCGLSRELF